MNKRQQIIRRLKIINGQIDGLIKLIDQNADCTKILPQAKAIKNAISSANTQIITGLVEQCLRDEGELSEEKLQTILNNLK